MANENELNLMNLCYRQISTLESLSSEEKDNILKAKMLMANQMFMKELRNILVNQNDTSTEIIDVDINSDKMPEEKELVVTKMYGGKKEISQDDFSSDSLNDYLKNEDIEVETPQTISSEPKSILKKKVVISTEKEEVENNQTGGNKETKFEKLERKLNRAPAETVKKIAKDLGIKPLKGKKTITKSEAVEKILANKRYHKQTREKLNKISYLHSETASETE